MKLEQALVVAGPVIVRNNHLLLVEQSKNGTIYPWMFPGGVVESTDKDLRSACLRELKEELGITARIIRPLEPLVTTAKDRHIILVHYLAEIGDSDADITPTSDISAWRWFSLDNLPPPPACAPNIYIIAEEVRKSLSSTPQNSV